MILYLPVDFLQIYLKALFKEVEKFIQVEKY